MPKKKNLLLLSALLGILLFYGNIAYASLMSLHQEWNLDGSTGEIAVTDTYFDTVGLTGTGIEYFTVTEFWVTFSSDNTPRKAKSPENISARYDDGNFDYLHGGATQLDPPRWWNGDVVSFGKPAATPILYRTGNRHYALSAHVDPVPIPSTISLLGLGLLSLAGLKRKKQ